MNLLDVVVSDLEMTENLKLTYAGCVRNGDEVGFYLKAEGDDLSTMIYIGRNKAGQQIVTVEDIGNS